MKTVTVKNPNEPATNAQKKVIGRAVKDSLYPRFEPEKWQALTKGEAAEIITELRGDQPVPASAEQKRKLADLIHRGFRKGLKRETFANLTCEMAKNMIWHAVQQEKTGKTIEGFTPRTRLAPNAPATERQKERLKQLIKDGYTPDHPALVGTADPRAGNRTDHAWQAHRAASPGTASGRMISKTKLKPPVPDGRD